MKQLHVFNWAGYLCFLLFLCFSADAANVNAVQSGSWNAASTWGGATVPGNGDTVNVFNGVTVTVTDNRTIGTSGVNGTVAVTLNNSGQLVIANGGTLQIRGNVTFSSSAIYVIVQAGGIWEFDSSASASPTSTFYVYGPVSNYTYGTFQTNGTVAAHAIVRSNAGGGNGQFGRLSAAHSSGMFASTYTDFLRIGDASNNGWQLFPEFALTWNITHSTFTSCGSIASFQNGVPTNGTFIHDYNVHISSADVEVFHMWLTDNPVVGTGTREIGGNIFDVSMSRSAFYPGGFTIKGNYFGDGTFTGGYNAWAVMSGNFLRYTDWWTSNSHATGIFGDLNTAYLFVDSDWGNPKPISASPAFTSNLTECIFGQAGSALGPPGVADSGELWWNYNPTSVATYGIYNSIILPNMNGYGSLEIGSLTPYFPNLRAVAEHNTWFGGWNRGTNPGQPGFPAVQLGEGGNGAAGIVTSFRSNILWNPQLTGYGSSFFKLADVGHSALPTADYCSPAACDYNSGYGHTATDTAHPQYINQGKGYAAKFSSAPGKHDVDTNPLFIDWQRSVELFDSKYLGNAPSAWNSGSSYSVGDFASNSRSNVYWSLPVNYRYINGGACAGTNPEPGAGARWRDCWEWASLYRIREGIRTQQLVDDQIIGAHGENIITVVMRWVRAGYAPTNPALLGAAHDGYDIGAVPVVFLPPSTNPAAYTGPTPIEAPGPQPAIHPRGRAK